MTQMQFDFEDLEVLPKPATKRETDRFVFDLMDTLTAPILTFSASWADSIPKELKDTITMSRLIAAMQKEQTASIPEVVAYIMTRTFESPMHREWVNIYTWCAAQYVKQWTKMEMPDDITPESLTEYEQSLLKRLRDWIYEKRRKCVKQRLKTEKA